MDIEIELHSRQIDLSTSEQSLAQAASSRKVMRDQFQSQLAGKATSYSPAGVLKVSSSVLKVMVQKYSEQLVYKPFEELAFWFSYYSGVFLDPGYPPLFYYSRSGPKQKPLANKSAVAALGEGVAGLAMQRTHHSRKLARPIHDYPDIVMVKDRTLYLVEAKATTESAGKIQQILEDEIVRMSVYTSACASLEPSNTLRGVLIGTALIENNRYQTYITEVTV